MKHGYITTFVHYTSWIYGRSIKGLCAHTKARCLEESIIVFKFANILTNCCPKKGHLQQKN
jgi:hypothetical protein